MYLAKGLTKKRPEGKLHGIENQLAANSGIAGQVHEKRSRSLG